MFKKMMFISSALLLAGCGGDSGDGRVAVTATAGEGGTISPGTQRVTKGSQATLTVQPGSIYEIQNVTGCGGSLNGTTYQTGVVNADCAVTASFKLKPIAMTLSRVSESIAENTSMSLNVVIENAKNSATLTAKVISGDSFITVEPEGTSSFNLVAKDVDRESSVELEISAQDGTDITRVVTQRISVKIENNSFNAALTSYKVIAANSARILALSEEKAVSKALNDAAAVLALKNNVAAVTPAIAANTTYTELETLFNQKSVDSYMAGSIGDAELTSTMESIKELMSRHVAPYATSINSVMPAIAAQGVPAASAASWYINSNLNTVSFFVGNPELGQVVDGKWVFKPEFAYINGLINSECAL